MSSEKRASGQIKDGKWLVLTESSGKEGEGFKHSCGAEMQGKRVAHPIHDGPFPLSGSGRCHYETIPFCPKCESEPSFHSFPINYNPVEKRELEILRRIASNRRP